jgi:hypothetical protein
MKTLIVLLLIFCTGMLLSGHVVAQHLGSSRGSASIGFGIGLPYGGLGPRISVNPASQLALFAGIGYNLVGVGYNVGAQYLIPSERQTEFFFTGMYGYNASIKIEGLSTESKSYYGPSFGVGLRINSLSSEGSFWEVSLLVPARSQSFKNDYDALEKNPQIEDLTQPWPVLFSVGYHFYIGS